MLIAKTPFLLKQVRKQYLQWEMPEAQADEQKAIYLTFDDGPIPEVTPLVLDLLKSYSAKATFFMVGDNVRKYPEVYQQIVDEGHAVGNHSYHHISGWATSLEDYIQDIREARKYIDSSLLRPPYGRIRLPQIKALAPEFKIIMWSVLSVDYDQKVSKEQCLRNVLDHSKDGSIIVFHDSLKAKNNLLYALPRVLEHFANRGFVFKAITDCTTNDESV